MRSANAAGDTRPRITPGSPSWWAWNFISRGRFATVSCAPISPAVACVPLRCVPPTKIGSLVTARSVAAVRRVKRLLTRLRLPDGRLRMARLERDDRQQWIAARRGAGPRADDVPAHAVLVARGPRGDARRVRLLHHRRRPPADQAGLRNQRRG